LAIEYFPFIFKKLQIKFLYVQFILDIENFYQTIITFVLPLMVCIFVNEPDALFYINSYYIGIQFI